MIFSLNYRRYIGALAFGCVLLLAGQSRADDNKGVQFSLSQKASWDSNPLMLTRNYDPIFGSLTTPKVTFNSKTPTTKLDVSAFVDENIFNDSSFNSTDFHTSLGLNKKVERWEAGVRGSANYDTTRTSELTTLGVNVGSVRHLGYSVTPDISFNPTAVDKISVEGSFSKSQYDNRAYTDYHIFSIDPSYIHGFTPLHSGIVSFHAQTYQTDGNSRAKVDSLGPSIGWMTSLIPNLTARITAGTEASKQTNTNGVSSEWEWNKTFSADLTYRGEQDLASFIASRSQQPYANGTESLLTTFSISEQHNITPLFSVSGGASYQYADYSGQQGNNLDSMLSASLGLNYRATDQLDLTTSYKYKNETLINTNRIARENVAIIGLVYHTDVNGISR